MNSLRQARLKAKDGAALCLRHVWRGPEPRTRADPNSAAPSLAGALALPGQSHCLHSDDGRGQKGETPAAAEREGAEGATAPGRGVRWVFLGPPGVGKGTYASRLARIVGVPHISMGDLVRRELAQDSPLASQMRDTMSHGLLLPDATVLELLSSRLRSGAGEGEAGFILDGFPRTAAQAAALEAAYPVDLALHLSLRRDVLLAKLLGRRVCAECGGNFNVCDVNLGATAAGPAILMPPLPPPKGCLGKMRVRADDTLDVVRSRLDVYLKEGKPVEEFYRKRGKLLELDILGGIPETWPRLLRTLGVSEKRQPLVGKHLACVQ